MNEGTSKRLRGNRPVTYEKPFPNELSPYLLFYLDVLKELGSKRNFVDIAKEARKRWNQMTPRSLQPYVQATTLLKSYQNADKRQEVLSRFTTKKESRAADLIKMTSWNSLRGRNYGSKKRRETGKQNVKLIYNQLNGRKVSLEKDTEEKKEVTVVENQPKEKKSQQQNTERKMRENITQTHSHHNEEKHAQSSFAEIVQKNLSSKCRKKTSANLLKRKGSHCSECPKMKKKNDASHVTFKKPLKSHLSCEKLSLGRKDFHSAKSRYFFEPVFCNSKKNWNEVKKSKSKYREKSKRNNCSLRKQVFDACKESTCMSPERNRENIFCSRNLIDKRLLSFIKQGLHKKRSTNSEVLYLDKSKKRKNGSRKGSQLMLDKNSSKESDSEVESSRSTLVHFKNRRFRNLSKSNSTASTSNEEKSENCLSECSKSCNEENTTKKKAKFATCSIFDKKKKKKNYSV